MNRESLLDLQFYWRTEAALGRTATAHIEQAKLCALIHVFVCNQECPITKAKGINYTVCFSSCISDHSVDFLLMLVTLSVSSITSIEIPSELTWRMKTRHFLKQRMWAATLGHRRPYQFPWTFSKAVSICPGD